MLIEDLAMKAVAPLLGHLLCRRIPRAKRAAQAVATGVPMAGGYDGGMAAGRRVRRRLCPRRRAVDRAAMVNVKLWKCENMEVWKYENGLGFLSIAGRDNACGEYARQFNGFSNKGIQFAMFNVAAFHDDFEPHSCLGEFFHRNLQFVDEVFAGFRLCCFCIVGGNACRGAEYLVGKATTANFLHGQCTTGFDASCGKLHYAIFKFNFHDHASFPYFHIFTVSYFHNFTILSVEPFTSWRVLQQAVVKIVSVYVNQCLFHVCQKMQGASTFRLKPPRRIGRASRVEYNPLTGSVGIVPNLHAVRKGAKFANWRIETRKAG